MFAIIPAAGIGKRLRPLTDIAPKPLLPAYNKPIIFYPLLSLREAGIKNAVIITDAANKRVFQKFLRDGKDFGMKIEYAIQDKPLGIAHAVNCAKKFAQGQRVVVLHSDNIFEDNIAPFVKSFSEQKFTKGGKTVGGAKIILKQVSDPERFGVVEFKGDKVINIEEKPKQPKSNWITTGCYMFDERVFDMIKKLRPSQRGEYEISELADVYIKEGTATYDRLEKAWFDVGTIDALQEASDYIAQNKRLREWKLIET